MKQFKFFSAAGLIMLMLFSCNSNSDQNTTAATSKDSSAPTPTQPAAPAKPAITMLIKHKVANFDKWFPAYEGHDSVRQSYGLHNFVVGRGIKDSNMVLVALHVDDTAKAVEFSKMPALKASMEKAGVVGAPTITYMVNQWRDSTTDASITRVIINQKVKDWDTWKKAFDDHKPARVAAGLTDRSVSQALGDPHSVSVVLVVNDMKKAEDFMHSKDLKDKMMEAGVEGAPDIFFYRVIKQY